MAPFSSKSVAGSVPAKYLMFTPFGLITLRHVVARLANSQLRQSKQDVVSSIQRLRGEYPCLIPRFDLGTVCPMTGQTGDLSVIERQREVRGVGGSNIDRMVVFPVLVTVKAFRGGDRRLPRGGLIRFLMQFRVTGGENKNQQYRSAKNQAVKP